MGEEAHPPEAVVAVDRDEPERLDTVEAAFAHDQIIGVGRRRSGIDAVDKARVVDHRAKA